jgi:hypothetical protein
MAIDPYSQKKASKPAYIADPFFFSFVGIAVAAAIARASGNTIRVTS